MVNFEDDFLLDLPDDMYPISTRLLNDEKVKCRGCGIGTLIMNDDETIKVPYCRCSNCNEIFIFDSKKIADSVIMVER